MRWVRPVRGTFCVVPQDASIMAANMLKTKTLIRFIFYLLFTFFAQLVVIVCHHYLKRLDNTWFLFDTLGLALFNIAGIQKTLDCGFPFWVAIIMGCITGSFGGVIRDVLLNEEPVIFRKEIYAMACVLGGLVYWAFSYLGLSLYITVIASFLTVCIIRLLAVKYHISLPTLRDEEDKKE